MTKKNKCKHCGKPMTLDAVKGEVCLSKGCPTNKKTKPICRKCQVVMEESEEKGAETLYRCPKCGVTSKNG